MARVQAFDKVLVKGPVSAKRCRLKKVVRSTELGNYLPKALANATDIYSVEVVINFVTDFGQRLLVLVRA
jgi:hypothetical protein